MQKNQSKESQSHLSSDPHQQKMVSVKSIGYPQEKISQNYDTKQNQCLG